MKETEVRIMDEGFEEVVPESKKTDSGSTKQESGQSNTQSGNKPDFRVVQTDRDKDGNPIYLNVGAMWKNVSKNGNEFYTLKIGQLKLLVFANNK